MLKLLPSSVALSMLWCALVWAQDAPADLRLRSNVPSIHVAFEGQDQNAKAYRLLLTNTSWHAATDIYVVTFKDGQWRSSANYGLIKPVGTKSLSVSTQQNDCLVGAALFDDGSYEGDMKQAVLMAAAKVGRWSEWERIKQQLDQIIAMDASDESKLEMIREQVPKVPEDFDTAKQRLARAYPTLPTNDSFALDSLRSALRERKQWVVLDLQAPPKGQTFAQWLAYYVKLESLSDPFNSDK